MPDPPFQPHFPYCPILCLLPLHDRTERVFRILQNYFEKIRRIDPKSNMRFKRGGAEFWRGVLEGRNAGTCGVSLLWGAFLRKLNCRRRFSSIASKAQAETPSPETAGPSYWLLTGLSRASRRTLTWSAQSRRRALQLSFHSGMRPGVHGAPAASIAFSRFARSPSISGRSRVSTCSNSCAATA
jgi:hypothetical protein